MNSAIRSILFVLSLCIASPGIVQAAECKFARNSVDKFTKARVVVTKWVQLTHWFREGRREMTAFVAAGNDDVDQSLRIRIEYVRDVVTAAKTESGGSAMSIPQGTEIMIAMSDGSLVKLPASLGVVGSTDYVEDRTDWLVTTAAIDYHLDEAAAADLMAQSAKAIRVITESRNYDVKIHKSNVDDIRKAIECVQ